MCWHTPDLGDYQEVRTGISQSTSSLKVYKPDSPEGVLVLFSYLKQNVPAPFQAKWSGGMAKLSMIIYSCRFQYTECHHFCWVIKFGTGR